jgi:hypothetical protein
MSDRTPYKRLTDRRVTRARGLIDNLEAQLASMRKTLDSGLVPGGLIGENAARLDRTLAELDALSELHEETEASS